MNFLKEILIYLLSSGVGILLIISSSFIEGQGESLIKISKIFGAMLFILGLVLLVVSIIGELLTFIFGLF
ncbi:hypothetical protein Psch_02411 [Pelotomaculum schinkii]|uniref:Uncharacterized protein n=1 Tax=Pelotomaculum schinkii TaxID=78350 RepID=A0A4Y7R9P8_9FIRM|nr:hypothetical protein [Pelotomaculum schinkii]TEB05370.1 hypothetical protein Psch_02411 [Pelotomaculum schinkii]